MPRRGTSRVADCTLCGRTGLGVVSNFDAKSYRIAAHNTPAGDRCTPTVPAVIYQLPPLRTVAP